jgi:hypothetical protein
VVFILEFDHLKPSNLLDILDLQMFVRMVNALYHILHCRSRNYRSDLKIKFSYFYLH